LALSRFLDAQQTPGSPEYHRWLTPDQFGDRFGAGAEDVDALVEWLRSERLEVEDLPRGRTAVVLSGRVRDVERAFATTIEELAVDGAPHIANTAPASVSGRFGALVRGLLSLNDLSKRRPYVHPASPDPLFNVGASHRLGPADFALIYDVQPLLDAGVDGRGATIAVLGRTNIHLSDTQSFRAFFGLPAKDPVVIVNGTDPGLLTDFGERLEANLDVQWSGGVAPGADVKFVISKSTDVSDGIDLSALYAVDHDVGDVISVSFGICETDPYFPADNQTFYANTWAQAAAQGTAVLVASGDSGAAGCDSPDATAGTQLGVNGLCTPPTATCAGGSQYDDAASPSTWWSDSNDATTKRSALSYIPETTWNESGTNLHATGGGLSVVFDRPAWQVVSGLADGPKRGVPDLSVNSANHTPYVVWESSVSRTVIGTSASAPSLAGLAAIWTQKYGARLGNLNPRLYALGAAQYSGGAAVFHDVTTGSNSVPGVTGYAALAGYDLATGLGTPDAAAVATALAAQAVRGDANGDGTVDIQDVFYLINTLFAGGPHIRGPADVNGDGHVDVADVFALINYLFAGGPPPV
jgi:subtilase family serine protease